MSDIVTLNGYNIKDEKAVRSYQTVALMKADTKLKEGYHVKTKGYYEDNDGGQGEYIIVDDDTLVEDGGSIHTLTNGLRAKLIIENDSVNVKQFGCVGDGETDDTTNIQNALNSSAKIIYIPSGNYLVSSTLTLPFNKKLYGSNSTDSVIKAGNFEDYLIKYGTQYDYSKKQGKIENIRLETNDENLNNQTYGLYLYSSCEIKNVYFYHLKQAISKVSSYIDNIVIERCHFMYCGGKENSYVLDLPSNGDAIKITQCQFGSSYTTDNYNDYLGIRIQSSTGFLISNNIINAPITLINCVGSLINNHIEGPSTENHYNLSNISISNSNILIDTLYIHKCLNKPEIAIQQETANEGHNSSVTLKNINITLTSSMFKFYQDMSNCYDLFIGNQVTVNIENVYNMVDYSAGWAPIKPLTGIIVRNTDGLLSDFNNISSLASTKSSIIMNKVYIDEMLPVNVNATNNSLSNSNANKYTPWFESGFNNSSVFYKKVNCYDFDRKLAASISSEKEVTGITSYVDDSSIGKGTNINNTLPFMNSTIGSGLLEIIYRGSTTNSYNKITKIPLCCGRSMYDFGTHIIGYATESRTAGAIDDFNTVTNFKRIGNNVEFTASATPSYGTFVKGDRCINSTISSGNPRSWVYDGTNWVSEGNY